MMQMFGLGSRSPAAKGKAEDASPNPTTPARSAMSPLPGAPRPVRLVYCDHKGKFRMDPEAALCLHRVKGPLGVVSVCGRSRQGKSFILNQLLGRTSGFEVAPTHRPCTKGLWMWSAPLRRTAIDGTEYNLLLLDSEGIDAYDQTGTYSIQIFSLAVLLSSMFIYNQMGGIDEAALDRLSLVTEMTKHIRVRASQSQSTAADIGQFCPIFVWLLRDFYLDLMEEGQKITPREYLELALKPMKGSKKDVAARNEIRESIRGLFPDRECFTLVRPVNNERDLQRLDQTCIEKLRPEFRVGLDALTKFVFERTRPKQVGSTVMTGPVMAGLTQAFLDALNTGAVPTIATSWQNVEEAECRRAYDLSVEEYNRAFDKSKPLEEAILQEAHEFALRKALAVFNSSAVGAGVARQNYENLFQATVKKCFEDYKRNAFMEAERKCTDAIQAMDNKLRTACNIPDTNLDEVLQDFGSLLSEYDRSASGPGKWRKLASFLCQSLEGPILDLTKRMEYKSGAEISALKLKCHSVEDKLALLGKQLEVSERNEGDFRKRYEDAVSDKKNISDEYASHLASIQGKYSSLEERYGNVSQLLEAAKEESFQWKKKYDLLVSKHKVEEQQMGVEIASIKTRCSSAESRLSAAYEHVEAAKEEAAEWRRKHDLAVKEAQTTVINITALKDQAIKQAQLQEDSLRSEFLATIAEKENKIRDSVTLLQEAQHHLDALNLQLKDQETELRSQEAELITLKGEAKDLREKLDGAKATIESSSTEIQSLEHKKSHLEQMLETQLKRLEETEEKYRIAEMDSKQAAEVAKEAHKEVVEVQNEKLELQKLAMESLDAIEEASKKAETFEKEKADLLQEAEKIRKSEREAVSNVSSLEAKAREREQEMEELIQSMTEQKASIVQGLENLLASERAARADADSRAEALSLQLQSTQVKLDALQQELTAVRLNETAVDSRVRSVSRTKRVRSEESAGVELVTDMDTEVENTKQRKRTRRRITESENAPVVQMPAESDSVTKPDDDSSDRRDTQDYLKLTIAKLKQELTKHGYGAELLQLRNPSKKDILALYEKLVLKK